MAVDARRLHEDPVGGVGRSLLGVIDLLAAEVDIVLLTDARRRAPDTALPQVALRPPAHAPENVWLHWNVRRWLHGFDGVFHGTYYSLPFRPAVPSVVTIHDLSFEVHPEDFARKPARRRVYQYNARYAARVARRVMVPSTFTKEQLIRCYGTDPERVLVTPWGIEPRFSVDRAADAVSLCKQLGVTGSYIVAMGGAPRRGLDVAVAAWRRIRAQGADTALIVVGREQPPAEPGLISAGVVDDDAWPALLAGADAFCYPTRYEGFGVPALESIASGTPIVCAPVGSLPEVLGDAAEWCETPSVDAIADGLLRVLEHPERAEELRRCGLQQAAAHPTWEYTAGVLLQAYRDAYES